MLLLLSSLAAGCFAESTPTELTAAVRRTPPPTLAASPSVTPSEAPATPSPPPSATPKPTATPRASVRRTVTGVASTYGPGYGGFLALPGGRGIRVRICGPAACITRTSNDAGPSKAMQRLGRVVDLNVADFQRVCGCDWRKGLVKVKVQYLEQRN